MLTLQEAVALIIHHCTFFHPPATSFPCVYKRANMRACICVRACVCVCGVWVCVFFCLILIFCFPFSFSFIHSLASARDCCELYAWIDPIVYRDYCQQQYIIQRFISLSLSLSHSLCLSVSLSLSINQSCPRPLSTARLFSSSPPPQYAGTSVSVATANCC